MKRTAWNKGKMHKIEQVCKTCGKIHLEFPSVKPNYCSMKCYHKSKIGKPSGSTGIKWTEEQKSHRKGKGVGRIPWNKDLKGWMKHTDKYKQKLSERVRGDNNPSKRPEVREKIRQWNLGKTYSDETNKKKGLPFELNPNWQGGKTKEWMKFKSHISSKLSKWSKDVKERDHYICQNCGCENKDILQSHHIKQIKDYPELILELKNGETLCYWCHQVIHYGKK